MYYIHQCGVNLNPLPACTVYTLVQTHFPPSQKPHEELVPEMLEIRLFVETMIFMISENGKNSPNW